MAAELTLNVTQIGTGDVATNKSRVRIDLSITTTLGTWSHDYTTQGYIRFEGTEINLDGKWVDINTTTQLYSAEHVVEHKADGTKTLTVEAGFNMNTTYTGWSYATKVLVLETIPRASTMSVPVFTLGAEAQIPVSKAYDGFNHTIRYTFGSKSGDVCVNKKETPVSWTPPLTLAEEIPKAVSGTGTLTITTYNGTTKVGDTKSDSFTAHVPASVVPTITSVSVEPVNDNATLNSWKVYVKGKTKIKYTIKASGAYGSTVSSHSFSCAGQTKSGGGGNTITGTTGVISAKAGSYTPTATVGDSRPNRVSSAKNGSAITVYDYSEPTIKNSSYAKRTSANSTTISVMCAATYSEVGGKNNLTLSYRTRPTGGAWSSSKSLTNGVATNVSGFATSTSYEVEISAKDDVSDGKSVSFFVSTEEVTFMLKDGGKSASFGKYPESNGLDMGWPIIMNGNRVTGLPTPSADTDAVSLGYVNQQYAPSAHTHVFSDDITGTVPVSRGGTGRTTLTSGRYLVGNGTGNVSLKTAASVLSDIGAASYETGTWTPTDVNSCGLVWSSSTMNYTKIGRFVQVLLKFKAASSVKSKAVVIGGLPFTPNCTYPSSLGLWTSADGNGLAAKTGYCVTDAAQGSYYVTLVSSSFADIKDSDIGASRDVVISLYYQSSS